jgi:hypothetical protein
MANVLKMAAIADIVTLIQAGSSDRRISALLSLDRGTVAKYRRQLVSVRRIHPPFLAGGDPGRAGRGSMAEPRFGPCILIAVAETRPSGGRRGRGRDEAATQARGGTTGLSVRSPCRRFGRSLDETATPQPTGGAQGYGRA